MAATNSNDSVKQQLQLQGVVRYTLPRSNHLAAKWLSTRMIDRFDEAGHGSAERLDPSTLEEVEREISVDDMQGLDDAAGTWRISYFEPGSEVAAVTPFILRLKKEGQIWRGSWALPQTPDEIILTGFGFEDGNGGMVLRYGV